MKKITTFFILALVLTVFQFCIIYAQSDDECMACHSDADISMVKNGKTVKLNVKKYDLKRSVHTKLMCVNCHAGYKADDIPHKGGDMKVNCSDCHTNTKLKHPWHPAMSDLKGKKNSPAVNCVNCHGSHKIESPNDPNSALHFTKSTEVCGKCHTKEKADHSVSEHAVQYAAHNPNSPTCIYCHKNPITKGFTADVAKRKVNQEKLCLSCHLHNNAFMNDYAKSLVNYENSVHGKAILKGNNKAAACVDCHGTHKLQKSDKAESWIHRNNIPNVCGKCHDKLGDEYMKSIHGLALLKGNKDSPTCTYCHGEHNVQQVPDVPHEVFTSTGMKFNVIVNNKMVYCVACHSNEKMMSKYGIATVEKAHNWIPSQQSHWETVRCVDCHSSHEPPHLSHNILPPEKTVKNCEECHAMNSKLMTTLYRHEKELSRQKYGFINGTILSDAYVIGTTRNVYLNNISIALFGLTLAGITGHGFLRIITKKKKRTK